MHDTYHCFLGDGFKCRELFSPCTSYDWWWILILPKSHIYCLYVKRVSRSIEHLRSHVEVEVTPAMSRYFSQRAIVSLHNSTFSKQRWHLKKKRWQIATFTYLVQPKCFCSVFAARLLPASRHTRCAPGRRLVQGLQRLARRRSLGGGGDWTADHMISEKKPALPPESQSPHMLVNHITHRSNFLSQHPHSGVEAVLFGRWQCQQRAGLTETNTVLWTAP